ncbi:unnamed protein product [Allacma fusca]|uniref:Haloacid dehalogenase-like hydrolase domain-containing protein 2 n=1 Tax=Allacma fusca TaxID=39272 RepID=A0A8J2P0U0_9HEXA|nr:unnamed protein product [Allacma fusca]
MKILWRFNAIVSKAHKTYYQDQLRSSRNFACRKLSREFVKSEAERPTGAGIEVGRQLISTASANMDEHGQIHANNLPTGLKVPVVGAVPGDLYIDPKSDLDDIGRAYQKYFGTTKYVLVDLSGTLHIENTITPEAPQALQKLRDAGIQLRFVTNTTKESKNLLYTRLINLGFSLEKDEIFTSLIAARKKIEQLKIRPYFLIEDEALEDFEGIETENPSGVVVGLSPTNFDYTGLTKAFRLLFHGCPLIAIHKGKYFRKGEGMLALGPGPFVHALEYATDSKALLVGKPNPEFFKSALANTSIATSDVVMIGDDVEDDVIGAMNAGFRGILVKTGKYQNQDELKCHPKFPTVLVDNFSKAVELILAAISIEKGMCLKEIPEKISKSQLQKLAAEREHQRHIDAYTRDGCGCYPVPEAPKETESQAVKPNCKR